MSTPDLLRQGEVAALLRCSRSTVLRLVRSGELRPLELTPGGPPLFESVDVAAFIARRRDAGCRPRRRSDAGSPRAPEHASVAGESTITAEDGGKQ